MTRFLVGGFAGTVLLTTMLAASQGLGLTRINLPYLLGTVVTAARDRAKLIGFFVHLVNGWLFAGVYFAVFSATSIAGPLFGALLGAVHAAFVLAAAIPLLPALHPRMASEEHGPFPTRQLEPPGFLALHYGAATPVSVLLAHLLYGATVGWFAAR